MENFEKLLNDYFNLPYRPEFLLEKTGKVLENYNIPITVESKNQFNKVTYDILYNQIFKDYDNKIKNGSVILKKPKDYENFIKYIKENCKLEINNIDKKEIIVYMFKISDLKAFILKAIYFAVNHSESNIYDRIFKSLSDDNKKSYNKDFFDRIYLPKWIKLKIEENKIDLKDNKTELKLDNIKFNYIKYTYFGSYSIRNSFLLNKLSPKENEVGLFSPDFLLKNKIIKEYEEQNFQIFNTNNKCPKLFKYILKEAIKEMNNKIKGNLINEDMAKDIGIMYFEKNVVGVFLNCTSCSQYYEMEKLQEQLINKKHEEELHVIPYSDSNITESKAEKELDNSEQEQNFYSEYNAHVSEEQLANIIVDSFGDEILNQGMERLSRMIFYFNLYVLKTMEEKEIIAYTAKEDGYGFEEMDGVFYLGNSTVTLNKNKKIPFLQRMRFLFLKDNNFIPEYEKNQNLDIIIEKNSFICMEVKNSFPLKYDYSNAQRVIKGIEETKKLINKIIRKSKRFEQIALFKEKNIENIHILFLYDSLLQKTDEMFNFVEEFKNIFVEISSYHSKYYVSVDKKTIFDIIYFVNPASINMRKISNLVVNIKKENENIKKENELLFKRIESLEKKLDSYLSNSGGVQIDFKLDNKNDKELNSLNRNFNTDIENNHINNNTINDLNSNQNKGETISENHNLVQKENNFITILNNDIKNKKEKIRYIKGLNNDMICLIGQNKSYIIKDNSEIVSIIGTIDSVLSLKNGDLLIVQFKTIIIYSNYNFINSKKIHMDFNINQIIELYNNKLLISDGSILILVDINGEMKLDNIIYKAKKFISSIIEVNKNEIAIIFNDGNLNFFNFEEKSETKKLLLEKEANIQSFDISCVVDNNLFVSTLKSIYVIELKKKEIVKTFNILTVEKIFAFNSNIYGIEKNFIYRIKYYDNKITIEVLYKESSPIFCIYQKKDEQIIYCTDNEIKFFKLN